MEPEVVTRPYRKGDEQGIVEVLNKGFGKWPNFSISCTGLDHWVWKYLENPYKRHYTVVSLINGKYVGANHAYPIKLRFNNAYYLASFGSDVAVLPEFRQRGIRNNMLEMKVELRRKDNIKITLSVTSNPIIIQSYMRSKTHSRFPYSIQNYVRIKDVDLHLRNIPVKNPVIIKAAFLSAKLMNTLRNAFRPKPQLRVQVQIKRIESFDMKVNDFWRQISKFYRFIIERRLDYLNWRYSHPHSGDFIVKLAEGGNGEILGYSVALINKNLPNYPIGYLVDLLTLPGYPEVANKLAEDAVNYFDKNGVNIVNCLSVKNHPLTEILKAKGFLYSQYDLQLFINEHSPVEELSELRAIPEENVHFSYGDIDSLPTNMPNY